MSGKRGHAAWTLDGLETAHHTYFFSDMADQKKIGPQHRNLTLGADTPRRKRREQLTVNVLEMETGGLMSHPGLARGFLSSR